MRKISFGLALVAALWICPHVATASLVVFNYTGGMQNFVVPSNVFSVDIRAWGAQGQSNAGGVAGGLGGFASGTLAVTPGQSLYLFVGGGGSQTTTGGFNGGGQAGIGQSAVAARAGGGGGASDVRVGGTGLANRILVAGGGGGAGGNRVQGQGRGTGGGGGGGFYGGGGGAGWPGVPGQEGSLPTGGTQVAGGSGGTSTWPVSGNDGFNGILGIGGNGGSEVGSNQSGSATALAGGVGGGLIGGNGQWDSARNWTGQSGAGGSSYLGGVTSGLTLSGIRSGNGYIELEYEATNNVVPEPSTVAIWSLLVGLGLVFARRRRSS